MQDLKEKVDTYLEWPRRVREREKPSRAPAAALGDRIMVRQFPPEAVRNGIIIPDVAQGKPFEGILVGAGDQAADKLYDMGAEVGDHVWFGKYAGVIESWDHFLDHGDPACEHKWNFISTEVDSAQARGCEKCKALRVIEPMVVLNVNDIQGNVDLQLRFERGEVVRKRGVTETGATRYYVERVDASEGSSWDIDHSPKAA